MSVRIVAKNWGVFTAYGEFDFNAPKYQFTIRMFFFFFLIFCKYEDMVSLLSKIIFSKKEAGELLEDIQLSERIMVTYWDQTPYD